MQTPGNGQNDRSHAVSPQQIAGWLKLQYPDDEAMQVSHETIYRRLFIQARGVLKTELMKHLRTRRMMRRSKKASARGNRVDRPLKQYRSVRGRPKPRIGRFRGSGVREHEIRWMREHGN